MKKTTLTLLAIVLATSFAISQSIDDGIKSLYYERTNTAVETLEKVVASNSKDPKSIYWLGQAYLMKDEIAKAKALYQKALNEGVNDPWIWVGMGHVELLENGDKNAARQKFDQAITATTGTKGKNKGKEDTDILNAIGRANADGSSLQGDPMYGIEKLKRAAELNTTNADIDINLGVSYLKLGSDKGGQAVEAFTDAITRNPQSAQAYYRIGRVYQSQNNLEFMTQWFDKAIAADPSYAPVYLAYFNYYKERDVNKAKDYLDNYVKNAEKDCSVDYFVADYLYRAGKNQESIAKAKEMESGACKEYARVNIIYAYNYDKLGDSLQAKSYLDKFFTTAAAEKVEATDYILAAKVLGKFPGNEDVIAGYVQKAVTLDTVKAHQIEYLNTAAAIMSKSQRVDRQLEFLSKAALINGGTLSEADYYKLSKAATDAVAARTDSAKKAGTMVDSIAVQKAYMVADSITKAYIMAFPAKPQGYSFRTVASKKADYDTTKGLAVEPIMQYNDFLKKDTSASNRKTLFTNNYYLLIYYAEHAKDIPKAIAVTDEMMMIFPNPPGGEEYDFAVKTKEALQKALSAPKQKSGSATTKPSGTSGK